MAKSARLVKCKACGKEIAKTANRCPFCGARQHQVAMTFVWLIIFGTIIAVISVLFRTGGTSVSDEPQNPAIKSETEYVSDDGIGIQPNDSSEKSVEEKTIYDSEGVKITFLGFEQAPYPAIGYYIRLLIENTSGNDYTIQTRDVSVDGVMVPFNDVLFSADILSGKKINTYIWITNTNNNGVTWPISSAELKFVVFSEEDFESGSPGKESDLITIK